MIPNFIKTMCRGLDVDVVDVLDLVAGRFRQHNIVPLRKIVGDEKMAEIMAAFSGQYTRMPPTRKIEDAINDLKLTWLFYLLQAAESDPKRDSLTLHLAERTFMRHAEKCGLKTRDEAITHARAVSKELGDSRVWLQKLEDPKALDMPDVATPEHTEPHLYGGRLVEPAVRLTPKSERPFKSKRVTK